MSFRYRLFLAMLAVFVVAADVAVFLLISQSFSLSIEREKTRALGEARIIAQGVSASLRGVESNQMNDAMMRYFAYYEKQGVYLALVSDGETIAANMEAARALPLVPEEAQRKWMLDTSKEPTLLLVGDSLGEGLKLIYARDVSDLYEMRDRQMFLFVCINAGAVVLLALFALLIARLLLRPLDRLDTAARNLARGKYDVQLPVGENDEIGALARSFLSMSQAVREREEQLSTEAQHKQEFIDSLAHEMRTPLTSIAGFAQILQTANTNKEQRERALAHIVAEARRLQEMDGKMLALAQMQNGVECASIDAASFLQDVVAEGLLPTMDEKGIRLRVRCECQTIHGDAFLLSMAVRNLVQNAANASEPDEEILLTLSGDPPVLSVTDRGCGMSEEERQRAFEPFWRADKSRSRKAGGAGLGLSLSKRIADAHGAVLSLHARKGGGTEARLAFTTSLQQCEHIETQEL